MKKPKFTILKEFKEFITRGSVLDLAVGMIIGAAFTAIVTALVNSIFKPLINAIPMGDVEGLITMLVAKDADGNTITNGMVNGVAAAIDLSKSVYIDWGAFIMAIVNFLLTAVILFTIVKVINTVRGGVKELSDDFGLSREERAELKKQGMNRKQIKEYAEKKAADAAAAKAAEEAANAPETTEQILKDIRELLKGNNDPGVSE